MGEAIQEAERAYRKGEIPVGAVVVCQGRIIARAHNLTETLTDPTAHAEMQAITSATSFLGGKYLNQCALFVTLEPCLMCAAALAWSQLEMLVYGAADPKKGYNIMNSRVLHPKTRVINGVMAEGCAKLLTDFFSELRESKR